MCIRDSYLSQYIKENPYDLIIAGRESIDYNGGMVPGMISEILDINFVTNCVNIEIDSNKAIIEREIEGGKEILSCELPLIVGGQKGIVEEEDLKIPNMRGIMQARKKPLEVIEPVDVIHKTTTVKFYKPETNKEIKIVKPVVELSPSTVIESNPNDIFDVAVNLLPEIKSAEKNAKSSLYDLKISRSGRYPTVSVSSNFSSNYSSFANRQREFYDGFTMQPTTIGYLTNNPLQTVSSLSLVPNVIGSDKDFTLIEQWKDYLSKSLSFSISIPIFNRYQTTSNIKRAKLNKELADINVIEARNQVRQTIETSYNDALAASKSYSASIKQVRALEESFRIIKSQYNLGSVNYTEYQLSLIHI